MKTLYSFIALMVFSFSAFTQSEKTYQFAKLLDNPDYVADKIISLSAVGNFGKNTDISVGLGADALWGLTDRISVFGSLVYSPINFAEFASHDWDLGGSFTFGKSTKTKDVKIVLKWSDSNSSRTTYNSGTGKTTETTTRSTSATYLESKAQYMRKYKVRGGLYGHKSSFEVDSWSPTQPLFMTGVFGGLEFSTQAAVLSVVDGKKGVTSGLTRIYADVLVAPVHRINKVGQGIGIGAKGGFAIYMNPNKARNATPETLEAYQAYNSMFFRAEIGVRPSQGWMFMMGTGIMIFRNR
ncbi:MAG: hypothetical protein AB8B72_05080 [Crocinitomicaceae bacterium]